MPLLQDPYSTKSILNAEALLAFDGVDDGFRAANIAVIGSTSDYSIEMILAINSLPLAPNRSPFFDHLSNVLNTSESSTGITIQVDSAGRIFYVIAQSNSSSFLRIREVPNTSFSFTTGRLYHFMFIQEGTSLNIYINGGLVDSNTLTSNQVYNDGSEVLSLGRVDDLPNRSNPPFDGDIGLTRIFNKALSQEEINQLVRFPYAPPANLHVNIVAEYIPQRSYFKDAANIYGLGVDAILWFDSVEQYNYARTNNFFQCGTNPGRVPIADWADRRVNAASTVNNWQLNSFTNNVLAYLEKDFIDNPNHITSFTISATGDYTNTIVSFLDVDGVTVLKSIPLAGVPVGSVTFQSPVNNYVLRIETRSPVGGSQYTMTSINEISKVIPNHGVMSGWTDAEVVDSPFPSAILHFYGSNLDIATEAIMDQASTDGVAQITGQVYNSYNQFIRDAKDIQVWDLIDTLWVLFGNGDNEFRYYNLKDPTQHTLNPNGGLTYNFGDIQGNGINGYLDTNWTPSTDGINMTENSASLFTYLRQLPSTTSTFFGATQNTSISSQLLQGRLVGSGIRNRIMGTTSVGVSNPDLAGFHQGSRSNSSNINNYFNGVSQGSITNPSVSLIDQSPTVFAAKTPGSNVSGFNDARVSLIGTAGDLSAKAAEWNNIVQKLMHSNGIAV